MSKVSGMIAIPASLRSDFIHIPGTPIHIALESTIHITGIRTSSYSRHWKREAISGRSVPSSATDAERLALSNPLGIATIPLTSFGVSTCCMVAQLIPPDLQSDKKPHTVQDCAAPYASL